MPSNSQIFDAECRDLGNGNHLHFINVRSLDNAISAHIDANLKGICIRGTDS